MSMRPETDVQAERTIAEVLALLDEEWMAIHLDAPINRALSTFQMDTEAPASYQEFLHSISRLILHIHRESHLCFFFPDSMACGDAIHILERTYQASSPNGYEAAYLDVLNSEQGIQAVLNRIAEGLKALQRQRHIQWVFTTHISACDWSAKCRIAIAIKNRWQKFLPPRLLETPPEDLAGEIPNLILAFHRAEQVVKQLCTGAFHPRNPETTV